MNMKGLRPLLAFRGIKMYNPTDIEWEVAKQMNADFNRLRNQMKTIEQMFRVNFELRKKIHHLEELLDQYG